VEALRARASSPFPPASVSSSSAFKTNVLAEIDNSAIQISEQANFNFLATSPYEISVKKRI